MCRHVQSWYFRWWLYKSILDPYFNSCWRTEMTKRGNTPFGKSAILKCNARIAPYFHFTDICIQQLCLWFRNMEHTSLQIHISSPADSRKWKMGCAISSWEHSNIKQLSKISTPLTSLLNINLLEEKAEEWFNTPPNFYCRVYFIMFTHPHKWKHCVLHHQETAMLWSVMQ